MDNGDRSLETALYIPAGSKPWPTVVFASGYDMNPSGYDQLLRTLMGAGFLVAAPASPGMAPSTGDVNESEVDNVPSDVSAVTTQLIDDGYADPGRLAAVGHSDGASAIAAMALNSAYADTRFRAFVVLAGDLNSLPGDYGANNHAPLFAAVGDADEYGNADLTPQVFDAAAPPKALVIASGGSHLGSFLGDNPQPVAMRAAIVDFLSASVLGGSWSALASLNGTAGVTVASTGLP